MDTNKLGPLVEASIAATVKKETLESLAVLEKKLVSARLAVENIEHAISKCHIVIACDRHEWIDRSGFMDVGISKCRKCGVHYTY